MAFQLSKHIQMIIHIQSVKRCVAFISLLYALQSGSAWDFMYAIVCCKVYVKQKQLGYKKQQLNSYTCDQNV